VRRPARPSLSIDVVSSVPGDMFTQMRTALVQERILAFTDSPDMPFAPPLTHRDVLEFATIDGARACAMDRKVGTIRPACSIPALRPLYFDSTTCSEWLCSTKGACRYIPPFDEDTGGV
jgi:hypothetical protein